MAGALGHLADGTAARLCFPFLCNRRATTLALIGVLEQLVGFYAGLSSTHEQCMPLLSIGGPSGAVTAKQGGGGRSVGDGG